MVGQLSSLSGLIESHEIYSKNLFRSKLVFLCSHEGLASCSIVPSLLRLLRKVAVQQVVYLGLAFNNITPVSTLFLCEGMLGKNHVPGEKGRPKSTYLIYTVVLLNAKQICAIQSVMLFPAHVLS